MLDRDTKKEGSDSSTVVSRSRYEREKQARLLAERLLEDRSRELYEANQELANALEKERQVAKLQADFIYAISHEFRTPLTIIDGAAHRISKQAAILESQPITEKCNTIHAAIITLTKLIEKCLSVPQKPAGR